MNMQTLALWLLAVYGIVAILVRVGKWLYQPQKKRIAHYYLLTDNSQKDIEWCIRSLCHWSRLEGFEFRFYIIDKGSIDDTLPIVERLKKNGIHIQHVDEDWFNDRGIPCQHLANDQAEFVFDLRKRCLTCAYKATSNQT